MKKIKKIWIGVLCTLLFCGCGRVETPSPPSTRVVTHIDITCLHGDETIFRHYTHPEKVARVLYYLRLQERRGYADTNPERILGDDFRVDICLSDGARQLYRQRSDRYVSYNSRRWRMISPQQGRRFYYLLQAIPEDT